MAWFRRRRQVRMTLSPEAEQRVATLSAQADEIVVELAEVVRQMAALLQRELSETGDMDD
jgi:predicted transcriptional regulator